MAQYNRKDHFYRKAKEEGFRSRAAYKLQELVERRKLFGSGDRVLDLGCAPGGWLQVAARIVGSGGRVVGVDLLPVQLPPQPNMTILQGDIHDPDIRDRLRQALGGEARCVLSDMAPNTTGVRAVDQARSLELVEMAFRFGTRRLAAGGAMAVKVFTGADVQPFVRGLAPHFARVEIVKPEATRQGSIETYIVAVGYNGAPYGTSPDAAPSAGYDPLAAR